MIDFRSQRYDNRIYLTVMLMAAVLLLPWLGETWFNSKGEPREAIVAVSILESGNWILPLSSGADMPFKPPFMAWLTAIFATVFNGGVVNEYLSRLPSALAALAMLAVGFKWARSARGDSFAAVFTLVTLTCFEVFRASMASRLDMVLTACMVIALYIMFRLHEDRRCRRFFRWIAVWALLTCATLTKGPVGALLPCAVAGLWYILRGDNFFFAFFRMLLLAVLAMVVPALWYYAAWLQGGDAFFNLAYEENIGRLTGTMSYESHVQPVWYNFVTLAAGTLPWILGVLMAAFSRKRRITPLAPAAMLALSAVVVIVGFYCIPSSKRSVYLLPAYPFVAYWITSIIDSEYSEKIVRTFGWIMFTLAAAVVPVFILWNIYGADFGLPPLATVHWYGYAMLGAPVLAAAYWMIGKRSTLNICTLVWSMYLAYIACVMPAVLNPRSDRNAIPQIGGPTGTPIVVLTPDEAPDYRLYSLNFYYGDRITPVRAEQVPYMPSGTRILIPETALEDLPASEGPARRILDRSGDFRHPLYMTTKK